MSFQVIPPVAVQETAVAEGKPLSFIMGSRGERPEVEPRHTVIIPEPFYLGTYPVTQKEFACFRPDHRSRFEGEPTHPVEQVPWDDAKAFLEWLNESGNLPYGLVARLPCEAEWEFACRAGTETEYWNGDGEVALGEVGWYRGNSGGKLHPVGLKPASPWGLHDMHGNVQEWCEDIWDPRAYAKRGEPWESRDWGLLDAGSDAEISEGLHVRTTRGGDWCRGPDWCRSSGRDAAIAGAFSEWHPGSLLFSYGFRVALASGL
jgi:formylglycine-generating enzyme required for sulfatase activity